MLTRRPIQTGPDHYRPDIDGIRALAVAAVVIFHAFPGAMPGGFLGVDAFFVISGFLITGIIQRDLLAERFSAPNFYLRRVRRIFPALIVVLIATISAGYLMLWPADLTQLGWHVFASGLFVTNFALWAEVGYFDTAALQKPLLHLWSLGIEEQFYIAWPILLWTCFRLHWPLRWILGVVVLASFGWSIHLSVQDPTAAFYSPLSRAWELAIGGLLATYRPVAWNKVMSNLLAISGLIGVVLSLVLVGDVSYGWQSAIIVASTCLLLVTGPGTLVARWVLGLPGMIALGRISYPLYLWHWPVLVFARLGMPTLDTAATLVLVALSLVLAALTYLFIERPAQTRLSLQSSGAWFVGAMVLIAGLGLATSQFDTRKVFYPGAIQTIMDYRGAGFIAKANLKCWLTPPGKEGQTFEGCASPADATSPRIVLWGDSHAGMLYPGLANTIDTRGTLAQYVVNACPPLALPGDCSALNRQAMVEILAEKPDIAILFAVWSTYPDLYTPELVYEGLEDTVVSLEAAGIEVVIVGPYPVYRDDLPRLVFDQWFRARTAPIPTRIPDMPQEKSLASEAAVRAVADRHGLTYLSLLELFCGEGSCASTWSGDATDLLSWDYGHLTTGGAELVGATLLDRIFADTAGNEPADQAADPSMDDTND